LTYLNNFSASLLSRTRALQGEVESLVQGSTAAELQLNNTFNKLLMLSNSQIIENRVYDDDDEMVDQAAVAAAEQAAKDAPPPVTASTEDLVPKFTRALNAGLVALDSFQVPEHVAEQLQALAAGGATSSGDASSAKRAKKPRAGSDSDSDEDSETDSDEEDEPAPKPAAFSFADMAGSRVDPYNSRPLPFVIGTRSFLEDDTLGLEIPKLDGTNAR